jgi:hypothetical protein
MRWALREKLPIASSLWTMARSLRIGPRRIFLGRPGPIAPSSFCQKFFPIAGRGAWRLSVWCHRARRRRFPALLGSEEAKGRFAYWLRRRTQDFLVFILTWTRNSHMRDAVPFRVTFQQLPGADVFRAERRVSSVASAISPLRTVCLLQYSPLQN